MTFCISIPCEATAGLSFQASLSAANHPAPVWEVTLHLRGPSQINLTGAPDGIGHKFTADAAATAAWTPGTYWWALRATDGTDTVEIERGDMVVLPDLVGAAPGYDGRTENEKALAAIDAVLSKRATLDQERYRINNRELYRTPIADLIKLRSFYAAAVAREKRRCNGSRNWGRPIHVRFS